VYEYESHVGPLDIGVQPRHLVYGVGREKWIRGGYRRAMT
jgi:hypothetical protein